MSSKARRERRKGMTKKVVVPPTQDEIVQYYNKVNEHNKKVLGVMAQDCIKAGSIRCYECGSPSGFPGISLRKVRVSEDRTVMMCVACARGK